MPAVRPFSGYLVSSDRVDDVVAPAYDALTPDQRHRYARAHPSNYVNAMRSQEEFPEGERPELEAVLQSNKRNLERLMEEGAFIEMGGPCMFIYRLRSGDHEQIGIVAEVPISEYDQGVIKKHEHTQSHREDQLARYNEVVGAASSPVCLAYASHPGIDAAVAKWTGRPPVLDFTAEDGVAQTLWCIEDSETQALLAECFAEVGESYLTDGHHRAAAGSRYAEIMRTANEQHSGDEPYNFLLVALFPDNQLQILPYNRCVRDLNGLSTEDFLAALSADFSVERLGPVDPESAEPEAAGEFGMLLGGDWYRIRVDPERVPSDPVGSLDVSILQNRVLDPILDIKDMRTDPRCETIAGALGMRGLKERCDSGSGVAFACYATSIQQLMDVADAGQVMPPKSTWFDPKVRSGIFLVLR